MTRLQNQLREIRLQRGWTQEELAGMAGVTRQTIIAIEKSKFVPSVKLALEISPYWGCRWRNFPAGNRSRSKK
jgi:putative transcriptional regulator